MIRCEPGVPSLAERFQTRLEAAGLGDLTRGLELGASLQVPAIWGFDAPDAL